MTDYTLGREVNSMHHREMLVEAEARVTRLKGTPRV